MSAQPCVFIVDDDDAVRDSYGHVMETAGFAYQAFENAEQFLAVYQPGAQGCLLLDMCMPGMSGLDLQAELIRRNLHLPIIFLTGYGSIPMTVRAMKAGAVNFLTKPVSRNQLIQYIEDVFETERKLQGQKIAQQEVCSRLNQLTSREMEILPLILSALTNKLIAKKLGISHRTVEIHRARILSKTGAANILELNHLYEASQTQLYQSNIST